MDILFCPDSFKNCITSVELCSQIQGVKSCPLSDGGEGFLDILNLQKKLNWQNVQVFDSNGNNKDINYAVFDTTAFIEAARIVGHEASSESSILERSSYGLGQAILHAMNQGLSSIVVAAGGTGVHDGGVGLLTALGARFLDSEGEEKVWKDFDKVTSYLPPLRDMRGIKVLCDVDSTFLESLALYAPNKNASDEELKMLTLRFQTLLEFYGEATKRSGVGGGISHALSTQCDAELISGFEYLAELFDVESQITQADYIVTGEGRVDESTLSGKVVSGVAALAEKHNTPCIVMCGQWDGLSRPRGVEKIISLNDNFAEDHSKEATTERLQEFIDEMLNYEDQ